MKSSGVFRGAKPHEIIQERACVLGSGTGLGLAYVTEDGVHETYGGHMLIPSLTDEQSTIIKLVSRIKDDERPVSAEDVISGPGLLILYKACAMIHGQLDAQITSDQLTERKGDEILMQAIRLFHEFLGLFSHQAVIYGHAYKTLYLDGGVIYKLVDHDLFDKGAFKKQFIGDPLPLIKDQLNAMSVNVVMEPYVTLYGLLQEANE